MAFHLIDDGDIHAVLILMEKLKGTHHHLPK
jgi:hypothetical protein